MNRASQILNREKRPRLQWILLPCLFSIILVGMASNRWLVRKQPVQAADDSSIEVGALPVEVVKALPVDTYQVAHVYTGQVVARRRSDLGFERTGKVTKILVDDGDWVEQGTPLAVLGTGSLTIQRSQIQAQHSEEMARLQELKAGTRPEEIEIAQAEITEIREQLKLEQARQLSRQELYDQGAISKEELDEVEAASNQLEARLSQSQSRLDELNAGPRKEEIAAQVAVVEQLNASLDNIELDLGNSTLKAPFAGTIVSRLADEGTVIAPGQTILQLAENSILEARVGVPIESIHRLTLGSLQSVSINQRSYQAQITSLQPELDSQTRTVTVILQLQPESPEAIFPGQLVNLELIEAVDTEGYWLPTTALIQGTQGLWYCYILGKDESSDQFIAQRSELEILHTQSDRVLVRGTLQPGDQIIHSGIHRITPGQFIRPTTTAAQEVL